MTERETGLECKTPFSKLQSNHNLFFCHWSSDSQGFSDFCSVKKAFFLTNYTLNVSVVSAHGRTTLPPQLVLLASYDHFFQFI